MLRILLVDDDPDARARAHRALRDAFADAELLEAGEPHTFETLASQPFDVLVTDHMVRWSDGFAVQARVKAASPDCCSVMFTGAGNEELAVRAMKSGFDDYLVKAPQQFRRLAAAVRQAHERQEERRQLQQRSDILLRELYHRLHNNLQIVISLVRRTARALSDPADRERLNELNRRIQAISWLQEEFYRADRIDAVPFDGYLRRLAEDHVSVTPNLDLVVNLQPLVISVQRATPLALIANELLTNAVDHGFPDDRLGCVTVELSSVDGSAVLRVAENGVGATASGGRPHSALELIEGLGRQIDARIRTEDSANGRATVVTFQP
jgi:two-component sensor histidine kinase